MTFACKSSDATIGTRGPITLRKEDHQGMQVQYHFRSTKTPSNEWDLLELVREIPATELPLPVRNKR